MSASKDQKRGTWKVYIRYTDWTGTKQIHTKRGFPTKKAALEYEREFLQKQANDINMSFEAFVGLYLENLKPRLKYNTYLTKRGIINTKILPYFGKRALASIKASDVIQWQNELIKQTDKDGNAYSPTYLRTVQNQLSAIFNHAVKFYGLQVNPSSQAGKMGRSKAKEMLFWTKEEYLQFIEAMKSKPLSYYAFEVLYWTGIREGELLALTAGDFDLENKRLTINKSYQRLEGKDYITEPKTEESNRTIALPDFLCREIEDYCATIYKCNACTRLFEVTKYYLYAEMDRGCRESGVKRIRVHDIRHSHVAHLISLGFSPVAIAERLGHAGVAVTFMYSHLYPSAQAQLADKLEMDRENTAKEKELGGTDNV